MSEKNGHARPQAPRRDSGQAEKEKPIRLPASIAARVRGIYGQMEIHNRELHLVLRTAQEALGVPEGWLFDPRLAAFVPPTPKPARPVHRGKK